MLVKINFSLKKFVEKLVKKYGLNKTLVRKIFVQKKFSTKKISPKKVFWLETFMSTQMLVQKIWQKRICFVRLDYFG